MSKRAEVDKVLRKARKAGAVIERLPNSHWLVTAPNGQSVQCAFSPGSDAGVRSIISRLRKIGVAL
jgi:hypothetical protein